MPTTAKTSAQSWIRAELVGVPDSPFGPQLMIPADGVEFHGPDLVFHHDGEVVYVTRPDQLRSLTWLGATTDPDRERRRAQWPNHGKRWNDEQRGQLRAEILAGADWNEIAKSHGRSRTGVQQEAVKQGWVDADTLRPAASLLADEGGSSPARDDTDVGRTARQGAGHDAGTDDGTDMGVDPAGHPDTASEPAPTPGGSHRVRIRTRRRGSEDAGGTSSPRESAAGASIPESSPTNSHPVSGDGESGGRAESGSADLAGLVLPAPNPASASLAVRVLGSYMTAAAIRPPAAGVHAPAPEASRDATTRPPFPLEPGARFRDPTPGSPPENPRPPLVIPYPRDPDRGTGDGAPLGELEPMDPARTHPRYPDLSSARPPGT